MKIYLKVRRVGQPYWIPGLDQLILDHDQLTLEPGRPCGNHGLGQQTQIVDQLICPPCWSRRLILGLRQSILVV